MEYRESLSPAFGSAWTGDLYDHAVSLNIMKQTVLMSQIMLILVFLIDVT
jgi:hypothetical protein